MEKQRRVPITEKQRRLIRQYDQQNPLFTQRKLAEWASREFNRTISQSTISECLGPKYAYLDTKVFSRKQKEGIQRSTPAQYPQLEAALFDWVLTMESRKLTVTGDMIRTAAAQLWQKMPEYHALQEPKWSEGWLQRFKDRHNVRKRRQYGESGSVDVAAAAPRLETIQSIVTEYPSEDIYNVDEAGLFWLLTPDTTLATRTLHGKKKKKDRITIVPCSNATGSDKLELWVIGKAKSPRCFGWKGSRLQHIPVHYRNNKTAWMTGAIFKEWLNTFQAHVLRQDPNRRVLLLIDGFSAHHTGLKEWEEESLTGGIRVEFLPENATSLYQPMDQGIIHNIKLHYRKQLLETMVNYTLLNKDPLKEINLLQCVLWILHSWQHCVTPNTITNCWRKSSLFGKPLGPVPAPEGWDRELEEMRRLTNALEIKEPMRMEDFINPPEEQIEDRGNDLLQHVANTHSLAPYDDEEEDEDEEAPPVRAKDALAAINTVIQWEEQQESPNTERLQVLRREAAKIGQAHVREVQSNVKQQTLDAFLGK